MQKMIFKKNRFSDSAMEMLKLAQYIASALNEKTARCSHLLAAITHLNPQVTEDILGKNLTDWIKEYKVDWFLATAAAKSVKYADELCALLIDTTEDAPLNFIRSFFPDRVIGPAELAFIILKEPTEEIVDILARYDIAGNFDEFEDQLCRNYLTHCEKYSGITPRKRLQNCIEMGKKFSAYMNQHLAGQEKLIEEITTVLVSFWHKSSNQKPLPILLLSRNGCGNTFFAQTMQKAFVELGLQQGSCQALDMSCFANQSAADCELLGSDRTYKAAKPGKIYEESLKNRRGIMIFENIQFGCDSAKQILKALTQNNAYDKYFQKNVFLPFNVLLFTRTLSENQYDFLMKNGTEMLDAQHLTDLLLENKDEDRGNDLSLISTIQNIFCLKELDTEDLKKMIRNELKSLAEHLLQDYQVALTCPGEERLVELLLQSLPHKVTPKELVAVMNKQFSGISKSIVRHPGIENIEIRCEALPDYPHDMERRTIRGDYLTFTRSENFDQETCIISFEEIKYATQKRIECGAYRIERPKNLNLHDIVGLDEVKDELQDALDYISGKHEISNLPPPPLGFILEGPPGSGKTATITALASHCDIPVFFANSAVFSDAQKIDDLFNKAKKMSPAIIVMDELNSIGRADQPWRVAAINTLLSQMDGVEESAKLLVLGSTNYVNQIEPALRRPGRFSRIFHVGLPEAESRELYIRKFEHQYSFVLAEKDRDYFVRLTEGKTIAVMKGVLEHALRCAAKNGEVLDSDKLESAYNHVIKENKANSRSIGFAGESKR